MQNAAFAECGLDWSYALVPVREGHVEQAVAGLVELGFAGANVTTPHKLAVLRLLRDGSAVGQHADRPRRAHRGSLDRRRDSRRACPPSGLRSSATVAPRRPFATRCRRRRSSLAAARGRPTCARPISSSTRRPSGTRCSPRSGDGQTLIDLPYPETATATRGRDGRRSVVDGLEVLVAQGAASFELWTGIPAPVDVMRRAVGRP